MDRRGAAHLVVAGRPLAGAQPGQRPHASRARHHAGLARDRPADRVGGDRQGVRGVGRSGVLAGRPPARLHARPATTSRPTSISSGVGADGKPGGPPTLLPYGGKEASFPVWTPDGQAPAADRRRPEQQRRRRRVPVDGSQPSRPLAGLEHAGLAGAVARQRPPRLPSARHRRRHLADRPAQIRPAAAASRRRRCGRKAATCRRTGRGSAFSSNRSGAREIWVADVSGDHALQLTTFGGPVPGTARWSPDQRHIAFDARPEGNSDIFVVPAGGGPITQLTDDRGEDARPAWSRDGRSIYLRLEPQRPPARSGGCRSTAGRPVQVTKTGAANVKVVARRRVALLPGADAAAGHPSRPARRQRRHRRRRRGRPHRHVRGRPSARCGSSPTRSPASRR